MTAMSVALGCRNKSRPNQLVDNLICIFNM